LGIANEGNRPQSCSGNLEGGPRPREGEWDHGEGECKGPKIKRTGRGISKGREANKNGGGKERNAGLRVKSVSRLGDAARAFCKAESVKKDPGGQTREKVGDHNLRDHLLATGVNSMVGQGF